MPRRRLQRRTSMRYATLILGLATTLALGGGPVAAAQPGEDMTFFNNKNFTGWEGLMEYWKVSNGAIVGSTAPDGLKFNTFLCSKARYTDFELKFQVKLTGTAAANSGVQIRSKIFDAKKFA